MSLWDDPTFKAMEQNLTPEQKREYKIAGELLYNTIDYETGQLLDNNSNLQDLLLAIKSGLRYCDLDNDDLNLLKKFYNKEEIDNLFTSHN